MLFFNLFLFMKKFYAVWLLLCMLLHNWAFAATDWTKTINVYVKDKAGNIQTTPRSASIVLDQTPPVITITTNPNTSQTQTKVVRANITDLNLDTVKYEQIPFATNCNSGVTFATSYSTGTDITLSAESDNNTKICFQAKDKANNFTYLASNKIENIDRTPPTIAVTYLDENDDVISSTGASTTKKISATVSDVSTGSPSFGSPSIQISPTQPSGTYANVSECSTASFSAYTPGTLRTFNNPAADNGKQFCYKGLDPAGNTSFTLVTVNLNGIPTFTSVTYSGDFINAANSWAIAFTINGLHDIDNDELRTYYSWDGTNWILWETLNDFGIPANRGPLNIDTTSRPEGSNTFYVRVQDPYFTSDVKSVNIFKDSILPGITIQNIANTNPEQVKYLSGTITDTNSFSWFIKIVDSAENCSLQTYSTPYVSGQNITLDNESYNGKKVCFKAVDEYDNIRYTASSVISWIDLTAPETPTSVEINNGDLFTNILDVLLNITHPDESDVEEWCVMEGTDINSCVWTKTKPTTYRIED